MSVVRVPPVLRDEAGGARQVEARGTTVRELLEDLAGAARLCAEHRGNANDAHTA